MIGKLARCDTKLDNNGPHILQLQPSFRGESHLLNSWWASLGLLWWRSLGALYTKGLCHFAKKILTNAMIDVLVTTND